MKAIKVIGNSQFLVCTALVMCCLDKLGWGWFWACFILTELNAIFWMKKESHV